MAKCCKRVNDFRFIKPGNILISCGIINFERGISPLGLGYANVSVEARGGTTKEYHEHFGLCSSPKNVRNGHVPDS
jgi:hypothetical protein